MMIVIPLSGAIAGASNSDPTDSVPTEQSSDPTIPRPTTTVPRVPFTLPPRPANVRITSLMVVLREQKVYAYTTSAGRSRLVAILPASTGVLDSTPLGRFQVYSQRARTFFSGNYEEKMDWMTRFTKGREGGNIGFHGIPYTRDKAGRRYPFVTPLGLRPSSHGCVRLSDADAAWIYRNITLKNPSRGIAGTTVIVVRSRPS